MKTLGQIAFEAYYRATPGHLEGRRVPEQMWSLATQHAWQYAAEAVWDELIKGNATPCTMTAQAEFNAAVANYLLGTTNDSIAALERVRQAFAALQPPKQ